MEKKILNFDEYSNGINEEYSFESEEHLDEGFIADLRNLVSDIGRAKRDADFQRQWNENLRAAAEERKQLQAEFDELMKNPEVGYLFIKIGNEYAKPIERTACYKIIEEVTGKSFDSKLKTKFTGMAMQYVKNEAYLQRKAKLEAKKDAAMKKIKDEAEKIKASKK